MKKLQVAQVIENLHKITEFVSADLKDRGCSPTVIRKISVVIDEVFGNIVFHGDRRGDGTVTVLEEFEENPPAIALTFIDQNAPFDPLGKADPNTRLPAGKRRIGGLGIFMVKRTVDQIDYEYKDGSNILKIKKYLK